MGAISGVYATQDSTDIPIMTSTTVAGSGVVANAAASATLPARPGATAYVTGFQVTAAGATAASSVALALTGVLGGTISYGFTFPAGAGVPAQPLIVTFYPAIAAAGPGQAITLTLPAGGAGNVSASVTLQGVYL